MHNNIHLCKIIKEISLTQILRELTGSVYQIFMNDSTETTWNCLRKAIVTIARLISIFNKYIYIFLFLNFSMNIIIIIIRINNF